MYTEKQIQLVMWMPKPTAMNLKDKLPQMSLEEKYSLLATNGMLVKRPILIKGNRVLTGFKEAEWAELLNEEN